jgi:predicted dehydrogenase
MKGTVRFGIIGTGRISEWVLKGAVLDPRFKAVAVCSRSIERAKAFGAAHGIPKAYSDPEEIASDPGIDAIYIGTPNHTHHDLAILCMRKGKHVMCEKPLASNAREVSEMIAVAKDHGVLLMEAMISTLSPNFRNVQERLAEIGRVRHYSAAFCQYSS